MRTFNLTSPPFLSPLLTSPIFTLTSPVFTPHAHTPLPCLFLMPRFYYIFIVSPFTFPHLTSPSLLFPSPFLLSPRPSQCASPRHQRRSLSLLNQWAAQIRFTFPRIQPFSLPRRSSSSISLTSHLPSPTLSLPSSYCGRLLFLVTFLIMKDCKPILLVFIVCLHIQC